MGDDLDPVSIRIIDKGNVLHHQLMHKTLSRHTHPHLALLWPLLELYTLLVKPLDGSFEVINSYANVTETSSRLIISRCIALELGIGF